RRSHKNQRKAARDSRTWRDIPAGGLIVTLHYPPREIHCPTHGRRQENIPWAAAKSRNTLRLECQLMRLCKVMPQIEAAAQLGIPTSTVADILHRVIARCRDGHNIRALKNLGIDEISYKKRHRYLTIVYDLDRHHVVWIGVGKGRETIDRFFQDVMSKGQRARVKTACCDMSKAYTGAISEHLPNALLVLDRFHVIKALNEAVDEVRKEQYRALAATQRKELKGLRFILLKNKKNRTRQEHKAIAELERSQRRIYRACTLKDELSCFWEYIYIGSAQKFLKRWCKRAKLSRIEPLRKFVRLVDVHWNGIVASISGITNAVSEGINRVIRMVKNRASGFRSTDNFANMIYLTVGDLDLPAQIQPINRPRQTTSIHHKSLCR
ncbi:MAG: ISL3 family transposase, partial [Nitrospirota bacterium]|nr:ISL3 family transposase [Nitrospirota bacterium]